MKVKWISTIRVPVERWGEIEVPVGYAVVEAPEEAQLPDGSIHLGEAEGVVLLALHAPGIHAWHPLFGFQDQESLPAIPPNSPHPTYPAWTCQACERSVVVKNGYANQLWMEDPKGVWCADHLSEAFAPFQLLYPTFPLMTQILEQWVDGKPVMGDPIPEPGPWPPMCWIDSESIREAFDANQGNAPPVKVEASCPSCGATGFLTVQETRLGREVKAPCSHLERAVDILARGPLVFAWGGRPGWTILPAGLVGPMGYRFAASESLQLIAGAEGIWVGLALDEDELLALSRPAHLPRGTSQDDILPDDLLGFFSSRLWIGREVAGAIFFTPASRYEETKHA